MLLKNKYSGLVFLISLAILFVFYHEVLLNPNDYLFASGGDGIKNYYTYLFHAKYDHSFWDFTGMNYPFYEHIVYTDAHPLLSWVISKLGLVNYGIGILNFLMLISYPIASIFLFKILRHYKVAISWAIVGAVVITFMSPQVFRLTGHFSLAYVFAIPIMWWLLIKCLNESKLRWSIITALYMTGFFFTHPYLGMILAFFSVVFWLIKLAVNRKKYLIYLARIFVQIVVPFLIFQGSVLITDTHIDRMSTPAGFYHYYAGWKSLLLAHHGPANYLNYWFGWKLSNWESWAYLGFGTILFFIVISFYFIRNRKVFDFKVLLRKELSLFLITAYLILLFSFCFPMKYDYMHWMADVFGPLKQFRVLGRFSWIFFYVFSVFSIVVLYKINVSKTKEKIYSIIFFFGMIFSVLEFYPVHKGLSNELIQSKNTFIEENLDKDLKSVSGFLTEEKYDAFIFLPFTHMSSENIVLLGTENANFQSMMISYHTGIPMLNSISSRMSVSEAILFNNFFAPEFIERELIDKLPDNSKIAVIRNQDYIKPEELKLEWSSDKVFESGELTVLNFNPAKWNNPIYFNQIVEDEKKAIYEVDNGFKSDTSSVWYYYESFDENNNSSFLGGGSFHDKKNSWNFLLTLDNTEIDPGEYSVSFWYNIRVDRPDGLAIAEQVFSGDKEAVWYDQFDIKQSNLIVGDWCFVQMDFTFTADMEKINILHTGNSSQEPFYIDELLVQKQNDHALFKRVIIGNDAYINYNNYLIKADSFSQ